MRKITLLFLLILFLTGCFPRAYIGMSESELRNKFAVSMYSTTTTTSIYYFGSGEWRTYYYFENGVCVRIDKGVPAPDLIIENRNR